MREDPISLAYKKASKAIEKAITPGYIAIGNLIHEEISKAGIAITVLMESDNEAVLQQPSIKCAGGGVLVTFPGINRDHALDAQRLYGECAKCAITAIMRLCGELLALNAAMFGTKLKVTQHGVTFNPGSLIRE